MSLFGDSKRRFNKIEKERTTDKFTNKVNAIVEKGNCEIPLQVVDTAITMSQIFSGDYQDTKMWDEFKKQVAKDGSGAVVFKIKRCGPHVISNYTQTEKIVGMPRIEIPARGTVQNAYIYNLELFCKEFKET